jgi:hypothetical protein
MTETSKLQLDFLVLNNGASSLVWLHRLPMSGRFDARQPISKLLFLVMSGTVCILGSDNMEGEEAVRRVVALYSKETGGFEPTMLVGSSIGAAAFGCLRVRIRSAGLEPNESKIDI